MTYLPSEMGGPLVSVAADATGTTQFIGTGAPLTLITWTSVNWDVPGYFASNVFTPLIAGYYFFAAKHAFLSDSGRIYLMKNVVTVARNSEPAAQEMVVSGQVYLNGTTDTLHVAITKTTTNDGSLSGVVGASSFDGFLVGRA